MNRSIEKKYAGRFANGFCLYCGLCRAVHLGLCWFDYRNLPGDRLNKVVALYRRLSGVKRV